MKKKISLEALSNKELFGAFENHKIQTLASTNLRGGSSTTLCKTTESAFDEDSKSGTVEHLADKSCMPPP
ncbi:hypothetical protein [Pedobacter sp. D749]|uniref:hypothetical protein n=1 Tax=Pedobacter sp. D749 TaxID=2856523 RepID=UPI001C599FF7|nr:hypothetical protein [Pedobacter sp. D749]QXU43169.1 hypothetical protein KYH19_06165 [Pedobacter sp. D749]